MTAVDRIDETAAVGVARPTWDIRSGVRFPDWSAIRSPKTEATLADILALLRIERCWEGYSETEDKVRRILLQDYGECGRAATIDSLSAKAGMSEEQVRDVLIRLRERDLVVFNADEDRIAGAYPFTDRDTEHRVLMNGVSVNAMCAIDALGAGAMYERDIRVASRCRACEGPIHVETRSCGTALESYTPGSATVWSGLRYADNCAATSLCTVIVFFCSDRHLEEWRITNHPDVHGHRLSVEEAHEVGMAIFSPMLRTAS